MTPLTPQSRLKILDVPLMTPGKCVICGSVGGDGRKFLDFDWSMDWYGAIYFCTYCITEVAEASDLFVSKTTYDDLHSRSEEYLLYIGKLNSENGRLKNVLNSFGINVDNIRDGVSVFSRLEVSSDDAGLDFNVSGTKPEVDKPSSSKERRSSRSTKPSNIEPNTTRTIDI